MVQVVARNLGGRHIDVRPGGFFRPILLRMLAAVDSAARAHAVLVVSVLLAPAIDLRLGFFLAKAYAAIVAMFKPKTVDLHIMIVIVVFPLDILTPVFFIFAGIFPVLVLAGVLMAAHRADAVLIAVVYQYRGVFIPPGEFRATGRAHLGGNIDT